MTTLSPSQVTVSLRVIREGQTPEGAYLASPTFPIYRYCWFRDGAFIAEAMDEWGEHDSAKVFHGWVINTVLRQALAITVQLGEFLNPHSFLHARYEPDGSPGSDVWPNFQLDGLGTLLWAYARHLRRACEPMTTSGERTIQFVANYLTTRWSKRNYDCWEEHHDSIHLATLGVVYAEPKASAELLRECTYAGIAKAIQSYLLTHGIHDGHFTKHTSVDAVDSNLLWLATPYEVVTTSHPTARATAARVRRDLQSPKGGLHRYAADTHYGGCGWILLSAALAQGYFSVGKRAPAERLRNWTEGQATPEGYLSEQTARLLNDPAHLPGWETQWGQSACPLLWPHAAYLSLVKRLEGAA